MGQRQGRAFPLLHAALAREHHCRPQAPSASQGNLHSKAASAPRPHRPCRWGAPRRAPAAGKPPKAEAFAFLFTVDHVDVAVVLAETGLRAMFNTLQDGCGLAMLFAEKQPPYSTPPSPLAAPSETGAMFSNSEFLADAYCHVTGSSRKPPASHSRPQPARGQLQRAAASLGRPNLQVDRTLHNTPAFLATIKVEPLNPSMPFTTSTSSCLSFRCISYLSISSVIYTLAT